ncbi:MAG: hypothetical protein GF409_06580 [Candidatus Omnitrophica bacterium]|nr:hypothetical protein [Candidatus Omnitrophota bacterium]
MILPLRSSRVITGFMRDTGESVDAFSAREIWPKANECWLMRNKKTTPSEIILVQVLQFLYMFIIMIYQVPINIIKIVIYSYPYIVTAEAKLYHKKVSYVNKKLGISVFCYYALLVMWIFVCYYCWYMSKPEKKKIICCGEALFDLVLDKGPRGISLEAFPGGSATNTSIILSLLGLKVMLMTRLGTDFLSNSLIEILNNKNIDTSHIVKDKNINTPLAIAQIDPRGDSSYLFYGKRKRHKDTARHLCRVPFKSAALFHTSSFFSYSDAFFGPVMKRLRMAREKKVFVTYDPNWRARKIPTKRKARERIKKILAYVDLLKLSEEDALNVTQARSIDKALKKIARSLKGAIIVTRGGKGSFFWDGTKRIEQPAFRVSVSDTIGAGDAYTAGLIYSYTKNGSDAFGKKIKQTLRFASAVSAIICSSHGATQGLEGIDQVRSFLKEKTS